MKINIKLLIILILAYSCQNKAVYDVYQAIPESSWKYENSPLFKVEIADTTSLYALKLNVRHSGNYPYANLWMKFSIVSPKGLKGTDSLNVMLADPTGKWYGKGLGDIYDVKIPIRNGIKFPEKGVYTLQLEQFMRVNPLEGIQDIGFTIEKTTAEAVAANSGS